MFVLNQIRKVVISRPTNFVVANILFIKQTSILNRDKFIKLGLSLFVCLLLCGNSNAQNNKKEFCDNWCKSSIGVYGLGFSLDSGTSWDKNESTKIFRQSDSLKFSFKRYSLYHGALFTTTILFQNKYPKAMTISRFVIGGILIGYGIRNARINNR